MIYSKEEKAKIQKRIDAGDFGVGGTKWTRCLIAILD